MKNYIFFNKDIWSLGDCSNLPTSKTMAGIFGQSPVLCYNIIEHLNNKKKFVKYDGYAACPIYVG